MKVLRFGLVVMAVGLMTFALIGTANAFHRGGVAECGGCHSMHTPDPGGSFLLVGATPSETCLSCHEHLGDTGPSSYHISTADGDMGAGIPPLQMTPGGDFGWLKKDYSFAVRGTTTNEDGQTHGHNIIATNFGYTVDTNNPTSPGGSYDSNDLGCASCHDPHGKARRTDTGAIVTTGAPIIASGSYHNSPTPAAGEAVGVYRLLAGPSYAGAGVTFPGVPKAVAPSSYNRSEASTQTRVAYGTQTGSGHDTWGNWCKTCHNDMHTSSGNIVHPVDQPLGGTIKGLYDDYVGSGDMTGDNTTSYLSLVPFMENALQSYDDLKVNATPTVNTGPVQNDQVSCLSCHRAHASGWEYMLRWNMEGEFIVENSQWPGIDNGASVQFARGRTEAETRRAYYDRPAGQFASYQRVLCNKCHAKD